MFYKSILTYSQQISQMKTIREPTQPTQRMENANIRWYSLIFFQGLLLCLALWTIVPEKKSSLSIIWYSGSIFYIKLAEYELQLPFQSVTNSKSSLLVCVCICLSVLLFQNRQQNLCWGQPATRYWSAVQYKQLVRCTQSAQCCPAWHMPQKWSLFSSRNLREGPRLQLFLNYLMMNIFTAQPQPQPNSTSTRVGVDKVSSWTTPPTPPPQFNF